MKVTQSVYVHEILTVCTTLTFNSDDLYLGIYNCSDSMGNVSVLGIGLNFKIDFQFSETNWLSII